MATIEPVGSGKTTTHWNCSDCTFWSKDPDAVDAHIVDVHGGPSSRKGDEPAGLEAMSKAQLLELADELGIEHVKKPSNDWLVEAIGAEQQRLADEAAAAKAAAEASDSGEGDQGGSGTPADDPDASPSGEAGSPPSDPS